MGFTAYLPTCVILLWNQKYSSQTQRKLLKEEFQFVITVRYIFRILKSLVATVASLGTDGLYN